MRLWQGREGEWRSASLRLVGWLCARDSGRGSQDVLEDVVDVLIAATTERPIRASPPSIIVDGGKGFQLCICSTIHQQPGAAAAMRIAALHALRGATASWRLASVRTLLTTTSATLSSHRKPAADDRSTLPHQPPPSSTPSPEEAQAQHSTTSAADLHPLPESVKEAGEPSLDTDGAESHSSRPAVPVSSSKKQQSSKPFTKTRAYHTSAILRAAQQGRTTPAAAASAQSDASAAESLAGTPLKPSATAATTVAAKRAAAATSEPAAAGESSPAATSSASADLLATHFAGMSSQPFDSSIADILNSPLDPMDIEVKPGERSASSPFSFPPSLPVHLTK